MSRDSQCTPEDDLALRTLLAKYTDAVNRRNADSWISCWSIDAHWDLLGNLANGREEILGLWQHMMAGFESVTMLPSSSLFSVDGETASGHHYLQEFSLDKEGNRLTLISRYEDQYRKVDGQWLFQSRHYQIMDQLAGS